MENMKGEDVYQIQMKAFERHLEFKLKQFHNNMKNSLNATISSIKNYSKTEPVVVDLNPVFQPMQIENNMSYQSTLFQKDIDYINL